MALVSGVVELKVGRIVAVSSSEPSLSDHSFSLLLDECENDQNSPIWKANLITLVCH